MTTIDLQNEVYRVGLLEGFTVFRNDCGVAIVGGRAFTDKQTGALHVIGGTRIRYGLIPGSGDFIGWTERVVTPEMVGQRIAVFTSIETKTMHDNLSARQRMWFGNVKAAGGVVEVWRDTKDGLRREREI